MNLYEGLRLGLIEIRSHKLRAFLTLSGIAIGITSVIAMTGILSAVQGNMREGVARVGLGRLFVTSRPTLDHSHRSKGLLYEDALAIRERFPEARAVSPVVGSQLPVFYRDFRAKIEVSGISTDWAKLDWNYRVRGRFLNAADLREYAKVCVLIKRSKKKHEDQLDRDDPVAPLFKRYDPLHKSIRIGGTSFLVVGVLEELETDADMDVGDRDAAIFVPITSYQKRLSLESKQIHIVNVDSGTQESSYALAKQVFAFLKRRHRGVEDFQVMNIVEFMGPFMAWLNIATLIIGAVGAIALFAGGVGIMNISLASVNARIKEIGIRKSVGAKEKDIRRQFLLEATVLSALGGVVGVAVGGGICFLVKTFAKMSVSLSPFAVGTALAVSVLIGLAFSWYPARRAARLDPIEALRYE
ncbi:MAG: ABC transporter permease [Elusimicrobia bacterium]|nr:ABC transporter permease [Elusimicrobiota bacterium]